MELGNHLMENIRGGPESSSEETMDHQMTGPSFILNDSKIYEYEREIAGSDSSGNVDSEEAVNRQATLEDNFEKLRSDVKIRDSQVMDLDEEAQQLGLPSAILGIEDELLIEGDRTYAKVDIRLLPSGAPEHDPTSQQIGMNDIIYFELASEIEPQRLNELDRARCVAVERDPKAVNTRGKALVPTIDD